MIARSQHLKSDRQPPVQGPGRDLILLYHRVADVHPDPQLLCVTPRRFADQLAALREICDIVPLSSLDESGSGFGRRGRVAITFDDGYADNALVARPVLEAHDAPATFFVTTGYLLNPREFWWDELERVVLTGDRPPEVVDVRLGDHHVVRRLKPDSLNDDPNRRPTDGMEVQSTNHDAWNILEPGNPTSRHALYRELFQLLRSASESVRSDVLLALRNQFNASPEPRATHRPMSLAELFQLHLCPLMEIGAHTRSHPVLAELSEADQWRELAGSRNDLQTLIDAPVLSLAYPFGTARDFDDRTVCLARRCGFERACANVSAVVGTRSDRFRLPRILVRNWDADELLGRLNRVPQAVT